jgi:hypothetical protein
MSGTGSRTVMRAIGLGGLSLLPLTVELLRGLSRIDRCLDRGGRIDPWTWECVIERDPSRISRLPPLLPREAAWLGPVTAVLVPLSLVFLVAHDRRTSRQTPRGTP